MKVLIVCSKNNGKVSPFIIDQVDAINKLKVETDFFYIDGKGITGYMKAYPLLLKKIKSYGPQIVHAHYGLSGLLSVLQRKIPVVITYHGSDINVSKTRKLSNLASKLCYKSIYVSEELAALSKNKNNSTIIPCGVDMDIFFPMPKFESREKIGLKKSKKYVLFSSAFSNKVKNYPLAKDSILALNDPNVELLELKGYSRKEVSVLMNAVDLVLLTSFSEGSPQFIKEALACNTPVVSVNVGDVEQLINGIEGNLLAKNEAKNIAENILNILKLDSKTNSREKIKRFDNKVIAKKIVRVYEECLDSHRN